MQYKSWIFNICPAYSSLDKIKIIYYLRGIDNCSGATHLWYSSLKDPRQQFQQQFFFISTEKHKRGNQISCQIVKFLKLLENCKPFY